MLTVSAASYAFFLNQGDTKLVKYFLPETNSHNCAAEWDVDKLIRCLLEGTNRRNTFFIKKIKKNILFTFWYYHLRQLVNRARNMSAIKCLVYVYCIII